MADLVECTNAVGYHFFASKNMRSNGSQVGRYNPTTIGELYRYFAVILHMGIKRQPSMRSYWSQDSRYSDNFVKKCFTRDRFEQIKAFIHVVKSHDYTDEQLKVLQKADPFWRMTPLLDHLSDLYQRYFKCYQDIDIDEMCIGFKGRHIARCYNPNKPDKWHLKAFCLNDSRTGYLHRFYMYQGKCFFIFFNVPYMTHYDSLGMGEKRGGISATLFPIHELLKDHDYRSNGYVLHTDNWYTSLDSCHLCLEREIDCIGTVKINRKALPKGGIFPKKGKNKPIKGQVRCMKKDAEEIYFTAWMDNKPVHMLSTIQPNLINLARKSSTNGWRRVELPSHSLIQYYNYGMGGTDKMDQLNSYYHFNHKGVRWTHRLLSHFLGVSVINACIIFNIKYPEEKQNSIEFLDSVIKALADLDNSYNWRFDLGEDPVVPPAPPVDPLAPVEPVVPVLAVDPEVPVKGKVFKRYRRSNMLADVERLEGIHTPIHLDSKARRRCVFHPNLKTRNYCATCDVCLCVSGSEEDSCWYKFHNEATWRK